MLNKNSQIEAYLDKNRNLKEQEKFLLKILDHHFLDLNKPAYIKDIGCGDGLLLHELARKYDRSNFFGLDISGQLIEIAKSRSSLRNLNYAVKDCRDSFNDSPDVIIASGVLSYLMTGICINILVKLLKPARQAFALWWI